MWVARLELQDFRNYESESLEPVRGLNLIRGKNAQGKTNLLEAIHCLGGLGSPRGADSALVRWGCGSAFVHAEVARGERTIRLDLEMTPGRGTKTLVNGSPLPRTKLLAEIVTTVFFGPDELSIVKGSPDGRRRFLDDLVVKLRPTRVGLRREWERVLRQRNALLKSAPRSGRGRVDETMQVWDATFCRVGGALTAARLEALSALTPYAEKRYQEIAGRGRLGLSYISSWVGDDVLAAANGAVSIDVSDLETALRDRIDSVRDHEFERGTSLAGPQRDDVLVAIADSDATEGVDARTFASQGDQRTAALALKLAEHDLLSASLGEQPILLLDDVYSELDPDRRRWLAAAVSGFEQTVITSADTEMSTAEAERVWTVDSGRVSNDV
jgi:DNA replication and repair protein RecF